MKNQGFAAVYTLKFACLCSQKLFLNMYVRLPVRALPLSQLFQERVVSINTTETDNLEMETGILSPATSLSQKIVMRFPRRSFFAV